jgi:OmpA-OmpF porin, OOP family
MWSRRRFWQLAMVLPLMFEPLTAWPQKDQIPAPQRTFMIFFRWNSADLMARDKQVIAQAAMHAKRLMDRQGQVDVRGYVDTSMSARKSAILSERMAKAVRDQLIRDGIDAGVVHYSGQGKTLLLKQTADGVREPINRRVEIRIQ